MSNATGHIRITRQAVTELQQECDGNPLTVGLEGAALESRVVLRDVYDVFNGGHWHNFAQAHHFMRRFENQTQYEAYEEGVAWIRSNARNASIQLMQRIPRYVSHARDPAQSTRHQGCGLPQVNSRTARHRAMLLYNGSASEGTHTLASWQHFGNALHALQDSFSRGHVHRVSASDNEHPGGIERILRYEGHEREGHEEHDSAWEGNNGGFSSLGRQAINASKALIILVLSAAINNHRREYSPRSPFVSFKARWLTASPRLRENPSDDDGDDD